MSTASQVSQAPQPLIMKSCTIALDKDEQALAVPFSLRLRVAHAKYTCHLFLGAASPNNEAVSPGDVWVTTLPGHENVYIRGESNEWKVWHKTINYGAKKYCKDTNKFLHSYHPWLRNRLLQFNGTDLGWHPRRMFNHHRVTWNAKHPSNYPDYESLDSVAVACYMKVMHLPRLTVFVGAQSAASTSSPNVPPATVARPTHPVQPGPPRPTVPTRVQLAAPTSSTGQKPVTVQPSQQGHNPPKPAVPSGLGVQPAALTTSLPPAITAPPAPRVQSATSTSSTSLAPAVPSQPPIQGPTFTGVQVQPTALTSSTSSSLTTATSPALRGQLTVPKPMVTGAVQTSAPSSTFSHLPALALPAQAAASLPPEPPRHEDVVSEAGLKRQRSSSSLSYASKERSPSPKRPNLGEKVRGPSDVVGDKPPHLSCPHTTPSVTSPIPAPLTSAAASASVSPAVGSPPAYVPTIPPTAPSSAPSVQLLHVSVPQPSSVSTVQQGPVSTTHLPVQVSAPPAIQPATEGPPKSSQAPDADSTGGMVEKVPKKSSPPDPPGIDTFLSGLPLSLSHHTAIFTAVGVTNIDHVRLLAQLSKVSLDRFLVMVRERGLSFMESLVLRSALNGLRQPSVDARAPAEPITIDRWLEQIGPSMACHAEVFQDLGIETAHIPVLAQLDAESFQEFENALEAAGLGWIHRFAITARIRDSGLRSIKQEPFLVA